MSDQTMAMVDEQARRRFESAHWQGSLPAIEEYLPASNDASFLPTLEELVQIEIEFAWKRRSGSGSGAPPESASSSPALVEAYVQRFPQLNHPTVLRRLVQQEYWVRHRYGDR